MIYKALFYLVFVSMVLWFLVIRLIDEWRLLRMKSINGPRGNGRNLHSFLIFSLTFGGLALVSLWIVIFLAILQMAGYI